MVQTPFFCGWVALKRSNVHGGLWQPSLHVQRDRLLGPQGHKPRCSVRSGLAERARLCLQDRSCSLPWAIPSPAAPDAQRHPLGMHPRAAPTHSTTTGRSPPDTGCLGTRHCVTRHNRGHPHLRSRAVTASQGSTPAHPWLPAADSSGLFWEPAGEQARAGISGGGDAVMWAAQATPSLAQHPPCASWL